MLLPLFLIIFLSICTFYFFYLTGRKVKCASEPSAPKSYNAVSRPQPIVKKLPCRPVASAVANAGAIDLGSSLSFENIECVSKGVQSPFGESFSTTQDSIALARYKSDNLVQMSEEYPGASVVVNYQADKSPCTAFANPHSSLRQSGCVAIVPFRSASNTSMYLNRIDRRPKPAKPPPKPEKKRAKNAPPVVREPPPKPPTEPTGLFNQITTARGRDRLALKFKPLIDHLDIMEKFVRDILLARRLKPYSDVVLMVVNEGEMDLFFNFACSCKAHDIPMNNVMVFAGSGGIIPLIESTGAMGVYHESAFATVSKEASYQYLDRTFVDMMWYKSFSVWLLLRLRYNILFQDVDLVWFRDPMPYFHSYSSWQAQQNMTHDHSLLQNNLNGMKDVPAQKNKNVDAFFSDDGNHGMRFSPFYGNSGFYFILANARTEYMAWTVCTAFDHLHTSGSHQNVLTIRMMEGMDSVNLTALVLDIDDFPTGMKYHHDKPYMKKLDRKEIHPYGFHMCWTLNKSQKLEYLRLTKMWYMTEVCSDLSGLKQPKGAVYKKLNQAHGAVQQQIFSDTCCTVMPGAP